LFFSIELFLAILSLLAVPRIRPGLTAGTGS
jgi:hypothetical protein